MALLATCAVLMLATGIASLPPTKEKYKILMLLPVSSRSHRNVFMPLAEGLADRGHKVVMLSNSLVASSHPNIEEHFHTLPYFNESQMDMFALREDPSGGFSFFTDRLPLIAGEIYKVPIVQELYKERKTFDLIVFDGLFNECVYPFAVGMPFITLSTGAIDYRQSAILGNVLNPSYSSTQMDEYPRPYSLFDRVTNLFSHFYFAFYWRVWAVIPRIEAALKEDFPNIPPLLEIERNQSLALINDHFSLSDPIPLLPSQVEVGAMHCRPGQQLPKDLLSWIEGSGEEGVVYFSLGSVVHGGKTPEKYRDLFVEAFKRLKRRVIWKFEVEIPGLSDNVLRKKWLPQQDILAHPKVKVFISHGGRLSTQEALYHGTPLVVIPIYGDQPKNAKMVQLKGYGKMLVWEELTVDHIVKTILKVMDNPMYSRNVKTTSMILRDQPQSAKDKAIWWTEYVIRHKGAPALRCPGANISWIEYLMLDALFLYHIFMFTIIWLLKKAFGKLFKKKPKKDKIKKE